MKPRLVSDLTPELEQRLERMLTDALQLSELSRPQLRAAYAPLELIRDTLSKLLDKVDGKHER